MPIKFGKLPAIGLAAIVFILCPIVAHASSDGAATEAALPAAVCQVIYRVDQFPSAQGYAYIFYGNAFFINEEGYLITASHVVSTFRNGGQPYILVGPPQGPRRVLEASLVAVDWEHDVAVLRASPNPFQGESKIAYLPLSDETPSQGKVVLSASFRPPDIENAHSLDVPLEDFSRTKVFDYQFHWENGLRSEVVLFGQQVVPGQSGSPLVSADSGGVVGIVVGRWLHPAVIPSAANGGDLTMAAGAALRIHYAISLLQQQHIAWHPASESSEPTEASRRQAKGFSPPTPLSVVTTPYPPEAMFGGEVMLDALIDSSGKLTDLRVVTGDSPFLETVLSAVRTWTFSPARMDGRAVEARVGIVFQFPTSFLFHMTSRERKYEEPLASSPDRGPLPVVTVEPDYPTNSIAEGSVVLYELIDPHGRINSTSILSNVESLTAPAQAAAQKWEFVPGKQAGAETDSAAIVVVTFRRPALR
jgi:TonB family protein